MLKFFFVMVFWLVSGAFANATDLMGIYQQVIEADPRVRLAELNVHIGEAREQQVIADLLPQLNITSSISTVRQDLEGNNPLLTRRNDRDSFKGERYSAVLSQPLFDLPKYHKWQRQKKITKQAEHDQLGIQHQIMLDVAQFYFKVLLAQDNFSVAENERVVTEALLKQLEALYKKKLVKITDVMDAKARKDMAIAELLEAKTALVVAKEQLTELTGVPIKQLNPLRDDLKFEPIETDVEKWLETLVASNPILLSKKDGIQVDRSGVEQQKAGHFPVIDFQLSVQRTDLGFNSTSAGLTNITSASVNLNMPLFTSGKVSALHAEAVHRLESSKLQYETEFRKLRRELISNITEINSSVEKIHAVSVALISAKKNYNAMKKGFKYGVVDLSDIFGAQRILSQAKRDLFQSKYQYIFNRTNLMHLGGTISRSDIESINQWLNPI
jgi:outer membrane protein